MPGATLREAVFLRRRVRTPALARGPGPHGAGPTALHVALFQSASPSSGSASGSASRGRGFNSCSSCSARGCGPAIVTRSHSALRRACNRAAPARDAFSTPGPVARRLLSSPARNRAHSRAQLRDGNFRKALGRGRGLCVTTRTKAEARGRLKALSRSGRVCACACVEGACWGHAGTRKGTWLTPALSKDCDASGCCPLE